MISQFFISLRLPPLLDFSLYIYSLAPMYLLDKFSMSHSLLTPPIARAPDLFSLTIIFKFVSDLGPLWWPNFSHSLGHVISSSTFHPRNSQSIFHEDLHFVMNF